MNDAREDLSFLRDLVRDRCAPIGRPSIDSVTFFIARRECHVEPARAALPCEAAAAAWAEGEAMSPEHAISYALKVTPSFVPG